MIVAYRNGAPVRLEELGHDHRRRRRRRDGVLVLHAATSSSARSRSASSASPAPTPSRSPTRSRRCCRSSGPSCRPASTWTSSTTARTRSASRTDDVQFTMVLTLALVVMVIFLFLRNVSGDGHPQPGAAVLDHRHVRRDVHARLQPRQPVDDGADPVGRLRRGRRDRDAGEHRTGTSRWARTRWRRRSIGSREIGFTIVSMTLSLAAVFIPVLFMGGVLGRLFREFAVTICVAILISGVVSVTLTPMLCSRFLKTADRHDEQSGWFGRRHRARLRRAAARSTTGRCRSCCGTGRRRWWRSPSCWR